MEIKTNSKQKITPFLWFNDNAEEAMSFYSSVFKNTEIKNIRRYGEAGPGPKGSVMTGVITIEGQEFYVLNGGPMYTFSPAVSFFVHCSTQEEVDELWGKLLEGGTEQRCGWLQDKFGLSWQIIPDILEQLLNHKDPVKAAEAMRAMLTMNKIDIQKLKDAVGED